MLDGLSHCLFLEIRSLNLFGLLFSHVYNECGFYARECVSAVCHPRGKNSESREAHGQSHTKAKRSIEDGVWVLVLFCFVLFSA